MMLHICEGVSFVAIDGSCFLVTSDILVVSLLNFELVMALGSRGDTIIIRG